MLRFNKKLLERVCVKYNLKLLVMFGSQTSKNIHSESDLDLAFFSDKKINEQKLYDDLSIIFNRADIDLINLFTTHNHLLRYEILSKGKVLYEESHGLKIKMEGQSYIDYIDFKPYYELRSLLLDKKLEEMRING